MNKLFSMLALLALWAAAPAQAAPTNIAQVPLLNITGTGTVKPNLMLLFDNSGSMNQTYTPDYVDDNLCRSNVTLAAGVMACTVGHPPFMSPDFNKQYYDPKIRYVVPIKFDGSYYPQQDAAYTTHWTSVTSDGFGVAKTNLYGNTVTGNIDLVNDFPDLKWCTSSSGGSCKFNSASYTYPDATYKSAVAITTGPYYYTIGVGQYCTDDTMKNCKSTTIGAAAPAGYPVPAKVRWCSDKLLTQCQGKRVGLFIYPGYSSPAGALVSYGTVAIGASASAASLPINSVKVTDGGGAVTTLTNGAVTAATGTNSALKQQTVASALAANIIATSTATFNGNNNSSKLYYACVKTPTGQASVPACSTFGITLSAENVLAVVPVNCTASFSVGNCVALTDASRAGWSLAADAPVLRISPAVVTFAGTTGSSATMNTFKFNGSTVFSSTGLGNNRTAAQVAASVVTKIGTNTAANKAYIGNSANCPAPLTSASVCVIDTSSSSSAGVISIASVSNGGGLTWTTTAAVLDAIPVTTAAFAAGSSAPNPFVRVNIVSGQTYPKSTDRSDCAGATCTYDEEMTNFANWYAYYKNRLQMMKTSVGLAFSAITANYKVGYVKLSAAGAGNAIDLKPADFTGSARATWYSTLYGTTTSGSTPIRTAMDNVGRMFANLAPYNYALGQEVVQYPCQQNFMILTTDGYWNGSSTANVDNNDDKENASRFCTKARGCVDPRDQSQPSIADVALHWYNGGSSDKTVSLRPSLEPDMSKPGSVPAAAGENTHLHMNTYTLGLGVDGVMTYERNYDTSPKSGGDFYNLITQATTGCPWNNNKAYVWPDPDVTNTGNTVQERVDDLWHAAINGHGKYFSAQDPKDVVSGLSEALANMQVHVGAAAASATSTPNITLTDNDIFSATFTTVKWYGELTDRKIDTTTGVVGSTPIWSTNDTVGAQIGNRTIYMLNPLGSTLDSFKYASMKQGAAAWFDNKCVMLSQCTLLSAADKAIANSGNNLIEWLRGEQTYADDNLFRAYTSVTTKSGTSLPVVVGDIASSKPGYVREPLFNFQTAGYADYKKLYENRDPTVLVAANDGMLHAFDGTNGRERWAYVPRITMKKLPALASTTYGTNHQFTADGSPEVADVQIDGEWRTVMVAGLNAGGRGFYALDVTETTPKQLWEFCADPVVCSAHNDPDLGLSFGNPQIGVWQGKWVALLTSGYNNVPGADGVATGNGQGILYIVDIATGALLKKVSTNSGDTATPSGLAKITAISDDPVRTPVLTYVYGGDNQGQMWRFDLTSDSGAVTVLKMGDAGVTRPITTRPDVALCGVQVDFTNPDGTVSTGAGSTRVVVYGTGRLLDVPDMSNTDVQALFGIKDSGQLVDVRGTGMVKQTLSLEGSSSNTNTYALSNLSVDLKNRDGWYFDWSLNPGERMNLDPQIVGGVANVVTNIPASSSACAVGGSSNVYQVNICNGNSISQNPAGMTLSNTSAAVGFVIVRLPSGQLKMITTLADGRNVSTTAAEVETAEAHRVGWRKVKGE